MSVDAIEKKYAIMMQSKGGFSFGVFRELVKDIVMTYRKQEGTRCYSLLSLQEAGNSSVYISVYISRSIPIYVSPEHFRGILHGRAKQNLLESEKSESNQSLITSSGLWLMVSDCSYILFLVDERFYVSSSCISTTTIIVNINVICELSMNLFIF